LTVPVPAAWCVWPSARKRRQISELLDATRFASASELAEAIKHYERLYNHCIPQKALGYKTPVVVLKEWHHKKPDLFKKKVVVF